MKKILLVLGTFLLVFGVLVRNTTPVYASEEDPIVEVEVEGIDWVELSGTIIAYVGGVSGLGAILAFVLKFIKDRTLLKKLLNEIKELTEGDNKQKEAYNMLVEKLIEKEASENAVINAFINMLSLTTLAPAEKEAIIAGIKSGVKQNIEATAAKITRDAAQKTQRDHQIEEETQSLLEKLAE